MEDGGRVENAINAVQHHRAKGGIGASVGSEDAV